MRAYENRLDKLREEMEAKEADIIAEIRVKYIIPLCDRRRMRFVGGMGSWVFFPENGGESYGAGLYSDNMKGIGKRVQSVMELECIHNPGQSIGSLMEDYTPPNWRGK